MDAVADRRIRDAGTPDTQWLPWLARQPFRTLPLSGLVPASSRLVVVAPHPDDEVLGCGALLAMRAALQWPCLIVAVSDGEASHGPADAEASRKLANTRADESASGLQMLGVAHREVVRLGLPDGGIAAAEASLASRLTVLVQPHDVVLATWEFDGHPDHEAVGRAARQVCARSGCRLLQAPVWMWHWAEPEDARVPWNKLCALELPADAVRRKQAALRSHRSQLAACGDGSGPVLVQSIVQRAARRHEYFFLD